MGMYFPREAAAWSLGVSVTWLQPCLLSVNLLASWSSSRQLRGGITALLGPGRWALGAGCPFPVCQVHLSIWKCFIIPKEPGLRWAVRPETPTGAKQEGHKWLGRVRNVRASQHCGLHPFISFCHCSSAEQTKLAAMALCASKGPCQARHCYLYNGLKFLSEQWYIKERLSVITDPYSSSFLKI